MSGASRGPSAVGRWLLLGLSGAAGLGAAGCGEDALSEFQPRIELEPERAEFGVGVVDRDNRLTLTVKNQGTARLLLQGFRFEPSDGIFRVHEAPEGVAAAASQPLVLSFVPAAPKVEYRGTLVILSNDPAEPELQVPLHGVGGVRNLEVFPREIDFGVVDEGTVARRTLEIRNTGGDPLVISGLVFTSTSTDLRFEARFTQTVVPAQTSTTVSFRYSPVDLGGDRGVLSIDSNDEDEPRVEVPVRAHANLAPRAVAWGCKTEFGQVGCEGRERIRRLSLGLRDRVGLDGRESADPEGRELDSYRWVVVARPPGSSAAVFHSTEDRQLRRSATGDLEIDQTGAYDLRLIVKDNRGLESFDTPESHVLIAPKDLEIFLRWDLATDVDLHFVRPGGQVGDYGNRQVGTSTGTDCSTYNRRPNWGRLETELDDPSLDIDVVEARGPEIVSLDFPETTGAYAVYAHYCDSRAVNADTQVRVEVRVRGEVVATIPETGPGYRLASGELWEAARVIWDPITSSAFVTELSNTSPVMRPGLCRAE